MRKQSIDWRKSRFIYGAVVYRIIDGDTVELAIDVGFNINVREKTRLTGINAPEMRGKDRDAGRAAKEHLSMLLGQCESITAITDRDRKGKYGRYLVTLIGHRSNDTDISINEQMVADGHAIVSNY